MSSQEHIGPGDASRLSGRMWVAVRRFDDELAFSVLNRAFAALGAGDVADRVVVPVLRRLGEAWHEGARMIAVEHFASQVVKARFMAHSAGVAPAAGPLAVCFTPAGDQHDLGLHLAAATLVERGWRTRVLGADTPQRSAEAAVDEVGPDLVVVGACVRSSAEAFLASDLARHRAVLVGGDGFVAGDEDDRDTVVVHHGPFAAVPDAADRLRQRVQHGG